MRGVRRWRWRRGGGGGGSARVKAIVRNEVERREKMLTCISRGEEFEDVRIYVRGCRRDVWYGRRQEV